MTEPSSTSSHISVSPRVRISTSAFSRASLEYALTLWENGHRNLPVTLALVVGEEETGDGAQRLVREYDFTTAIVGEPTDLAPCLSHYGYLEVQLVTKGLRMHASLAPQAANAVTAMLHLLLEFLQFLDKRLTDAVYNVRDLTSARSGFAVPDYCEAWIDLHLPALSDMGHITYELEELHQAFCKAHPESDSAIHFTTIHNGYELPQKGPMMEVMQEVYQRHGLPMAPGPFPSHSDANILWAAGIKPILLGPGKLEKAHTADESTSFAQVVQAARLYVDLALEAEEKV